MGIRTNQCELFKSLDICSNNQITVSEKKLPLQGFLTDSQAISLAMGFFAFGWLILLMNGHPILSISCIFVFPIISMFYLGANMGIPPLNHEWVRCRSCRVDFAVPTIIAGPNVVIANMDDPNTFRCRKCKIYKSGKINQNIRINKIKQKINQLPPSISKSSITEIKSDLNRLESELEDELNRNAELDELITKLQNKLNKLDSDDSRINQNVNITINDSVVIDTTFDNSINKEK